METKWSELEVEWDHGPCDPNDVRSCHQSVRVAPDGRMVQTETPNPGVSSTPKTRSAALSSSEMGELGRIIDAGFVGQMKAGFPCSQDTPDASTTIFLTTEGKKEKQDVSPCLRDGAPPNQAAGIVKILEPYRFVH